MSGVTSRHETTPIVRSAQKLLRVSAVKVVCLWRLCKSMVALNASNTSGLSRPSQQYIPDQPRCNDVLFSFSIRPDELMCNAIVSTLYEYDPLAYPGTAPPAPPSKSPWPSKSPCLLHLNLRYIISQKPDHIAPISEGCNQVDSGNLAGWFSIKSTFGATTNQVEVHFFLGSGVRFGLLLSFIHATSFTP